MHTHTHHLRLVYIYAHTHTPSSIYLCTHAHTGADLCSIYMARLPANSTQWSEATLLSQRKGYSNQNPVFYYDSKTGCLNLWHSQQVAVKEIERCCVCACVCSKLYTIAYIVTFKQSTTLEM